MIRRVLSVLALASLPALTPGIVHTQQAAARSVKDGVYTAVQAKQGGSVPLTDDPETLKQIRLDAGPGR